MAEQKGLTVAAPRLPYPEDAEAFGFSPDTWRVLCEAIFPNAKSPHSIILALAYCRARNLDPLKRPVHIVPIWDSKRGCEVETIWPGIGELRTTAARTKEYAGKDKTEYGPEITKTFEDESGKYGAATVAFPEWAQVTVYRLVGGVRCPFPGPKVYWLETYATRSNKTDVPNQMWNDRPSGQLEKCAEAASLRAAFPEIGNEYAAEEMEGRRFETFGRTEEGHDLMRPRRKSEAQKAAPSSASETTTKEPLVALDTAEKYLVRGVEERKKKNGDPYWVVTVELPNGDKVLASTFSDTDAGIAGSLINGRAHVKLSTREKDGKTYTNLEAIEPAVDESEPEEPGAEG